MVVPGPSVVRLNPLDMLSDVQYSVSTLVVANRGCSELRYGALRRAGLPHRRHQHCHGQKWERLSNLPMTSPSPLVNKYDLIVEFESMRGTLGHEWQMTSPPHCAMDAIGGARNPTLPLDVLIRIMHFLPPSGLLILATSNKTLCGFALPLLYYNIYPKGAMQMEHIIRGLKFCEEKTGKQPRPRYLNLSMLGHTFRVGRAVSTLLRLTDLEAVRFLQMPFINHISLTPSAIAQVSQGIAGEWSLAIQDDPEDFYNSEEFYCPSVELEVLKRCSGKAIEEIRLTSHREWQGSFVLDYHSLDQFAPRCRVVVLSGYNCSVPGRTLAQALGNMPHLEYLEICEFSTITREDLLSLASPHLPFRLKGFRVGPVPLIHLPALAQVLHLHGTTLKHLYICEEIQDCQAITSAIKQSCTALKRLALFVPRMTREGLDSITSMRNLTHFVSKYLLSSFVELTISSGRSTRIGCCRHCSTHRRQSQSRSSRYTL
jgi:hypothetical protein